jgi:hypothetical protein
LPLSLTPLIPSLGHFFFFRALGFTLHSLFSLIATAALCTEPSSFVFFIGSFPHGSLSHQLSLSSLLSIASGV